MSKVKPVSKKFFQNLRLASSMISLYVIMLLFLVASFAVTPFVHIEPVNAVYYSKPIPKDVPIQTGKPSTLTIPSLDIDLSIDAGFYNDEDKSWTLSTRGVFHADVSARPNDYGGNTFIYGHNNKYVFGPLTQMSIGETAIVSTENNLDFVYVLKEKQTFDPSNTSALGYTPKPRLTLQTCSGKWNEKRDMYIFDLQEVRPL